MAADETALPPSLGKVAPRSLAVRGITRFEQLTHMSERELLSIHGVDPKAIRVWRGELESSGLGFRDG